MKKQSELYHIVAKWIDEVKDASLEKTSKFRDKFESLEKDNFGDVSERIKFFSYEI